jgi:CRP-like cAMP-binding protein
MRALNRPFRRKLHHCVRKPFGFSCAGGALCSAQALPRTTGLRGLSTASFQRAPRLPRVVPPTIPRSQEELIESLEGLVESLQRALRVKARSSVPARHFHSSSQARRRVRALTGALQRDTSSMGPHAVQGKAPRLEGRTIVESGTAELSPAMLRLRTVFGNLGYCCTLIGYTMEDMLYLRLLMMSSGVLTIVFASMHSPPIWIPIIWCTIFFIVNFTFVVRLLAERKEVEFTGAALDTYESAFQPHGFTPRQFQQLLTKGQAEFRQVFEGDPLVLQGDPLRYLVFLVNGEADLVIGDRCVAAIRGGSFATSLQCLLPSKEAKAVAQVAHAVAEQEAEERDPSEERSPDILSDESFHSLQVQARYSKAAQPESSGFHPPILRRHLRDEPWVKAATGEGAPEPVAEASARPVSLAAGGRTGALIHSSHTDPTVTPMLDPPPDLGMLIREATASFRQAADALSLVLSDAFRERVVVDDDDEEEEEEEKEEIAILPVESTRPFKAESVVDEEEGAASLPHHVFADDMSAGSRYMNATKGTRPRAPSEVMADETGGELGQDPEELLRTSPLAHREHLRGKRRDKEEAAVKRQVLDRQGASASDRALRIRDTVRQVVEEQAGFPVILPDEDIIEDPSSSLLNPVEAVPFDQFRLPARLGRLRGSAPSGPSTPMLPPGNGETEVDLEVSIEAAQAFVQAAGDRGGWRALSKQEGEPVLPKAAKPQSDATPTEATATVVVASPEATVLVWDLQALRQTIEANKAMRFPLMSLVASEVASRLLLTTRSLQRSYQYREELRNRIREGSGKLSEQDKLDLEQWRMEESVTEQEHQEALVAVGWTPKDYQRGWSPAQAKAARAKAVQRASEGMRAAYDSVATGARQVGGFFGGLFGGKSEERA